MMRGGGYDPDRQGRQGGAIIGGVNALERLKPEIEPVPRPIRTLCLPQLCESALGRTAGLAPAVCGVSARKDQSVEHRLGATRFQLFALTVVVEGLLSAVVLHAPCGFLEESHLLGRCGTHLHRSPESWPCHHVRDG